MKKIWKVLSANIVISHFAWLAFGLMIMISLALVPKAEATPTVTINSLSSPISNSTATISGTMSSGATITASVNTTATVGPISYPTGTTWRCTITGLVVGANIVTAIATDASGTTATAKITLDPSLVGRWRMDGNWTDTSGNGNNATAYNGATFSTDTPVSSQAGSFDGVNDYAEIANPTGALNLRNQSWSLAAWVKTSFTGTTNMSVINRFECGWNNCSSPDGNSGAMYHLLVNGSGFATMSIQTDGFVLYQVSDTVNIRDGQWHYLVGVLDRAANLLRIYVDGTEKGNTSAANAAGINDGGSPVEIGRQYISPQQSWGPSKFYFNGTIDEITVYARALSTAEILNAYTNLPPSVHVFSPAAGSTNDPTPLLSYTVSEGAITVKVDGQIVSKVSGDSLDLLSDGTHTVRVEAMNTVGDIGYAESSFTIDTVPPSISINPVTSPTNTTSQTITGTMSLGSTVTVTVNTSAVAGPVSYPTNTTWSCVITNLVSGQNVITVVSTDAAGNSASASATVNYVNVGPGLVGFWHMDGDWKDTSGNGNNVTAYSGAVISPNARVGSGAGSFNGANSYTEKTSPANLNIGNQSWTIMAWVKSSYTGTNVMAVVCRYEAGWNGNIPDGNNRAFYKLAFDESGFARMYVRSDNSNSPVQVADNVNIRDGQWHHIAGVLDRSAQLLRIYVDGGERNNVSAASMNVVNDSGSPLDIGRCYAGSGSSNYFNGLMDEVAMYNRALTREEIRYAYNPNPAPTVNITSPTSPVITQRTPLLTYTTSGGTVVVKVDGTVVQTTSGSYLDALTEGQHILRVEATDDQGNVGFDQVAFTVNSFSALWHMDGDWRDASINNNNGTAYGGAGFSTDSCLGSQSGNFDGSAMFINVADNSSLRASTGLTIEGWIKPRDIGNYRQIVSKFGSGGNYSYKMGLAPTGNLRIDISGDGTNSDALATTSSPINLNTWQHVAATFDSGAVRLYVNGIEVASKTSAITSLKAGTDPLNIGRSGQGIQYFNGLIDEVAVYTRALSIQEIMDRYDTGQTSISINLVTSPTKTTVQTITGTMSLGSTVTVSVNTAASTGAVTYPTSKTWSCTITNLARGENVITVTARKSSGNTATATATIVQDDIKITAVAANTEVLDVSTPNVATVFFTLDTQATVTLKIIPELQGPPGTPVYQTSQNCPTAGAYAFNWDGKNSAGQSLPDDAYLYVLEAANGIVTTLYSPDAPSGSATITCTKSDTFDPLKNEPMLINYSVSVPARITVSVTKPTPWRYDVLNAIPSTAGTFSKTWNGRSNDGKFVLQTGGSIYCSATPFRENHIITVGDAPVISNVSIDPYQISLSYGAFANIRYHLNRDANVSVWLIPLTGSAMSLLNSQLQTAGDHEIVWNGLDLTDSTGKKAVITREGSYAIKIMAVNPVTGTSSSEFGSVQIGF